MLETFWAVISACGALASVGAAVVAWLTFRRVTRKEDRLLRAELEADFDRYREKRRRFWEILKRIYPSEPGEVSLDDLVKSVGMPPNVPPPEGEYLYLWVHKHAQYLGVDERKLLGFVRTVYRSDNVVSSTLAMSVIDADDRVRFDELRRSMSTFFCRWHSRVGTDGLRSLADVKSDVAMLSWLQLALAAVLREERGGEEGLFVYGNDLWST